MTNDWKKIWDSKTAKDEILLKGSREDVLLELKRSNGFDVAEGMSYKAFYKQYEEIRNSLQKYKEVKSVYEIGCGSGANLFLFEGEGYVTGGVDYSRGLTEITKKVLKTSDILCAEAIEFSTDEKYDAVFSNSVFSYFESETYARNVLEKMYQKTRNVIGLIDIHNIEKKEEFITYRRKIVEDYDKKYENLPKLFYTKEFFEAFAKEYDMLVEFSECEMEGYWNNPFVFSCYMYKR